MNQAILCQLTNKLATPPVAIPTASLAPDHNFAELARLATTLSMEFAQSTALKTAWLTVPLVRL